MTISQTTLKNAAFAIEHDLFTDPDGSNYLVKDGAILRRWEPETSSADSFELMVALTIHVQCCRRTTFAEMQEYTASCSHNGDPSAATRIAILECAAHIGAALCQSQLAHGLCGPICCLPLM